MNPRPIHDVFENEIYLNGGLTYDPNYGFMRDTPESRFNFGRYIVGVKNVHVINGSIKQSQIVKLVNDALSAKGMLIGAWKDSETGLTHWDYVKCYDSLEEAIDQAISGQEIAIWDSWDNVEIRL